MSEKLITLFEKLGYLILLAREVPINQSVSTGSSIPIVVCPAMQPGTGQSNSTPKVSVPSRNPKIQQIKYKKMDFSTTSYVQLRRELTYVDRFVQPPRNKTGKVRLTIPNFKQ